MVVLYSYYYWAGGPPKRSLRFTEEGMGFDFWCRVVKFVFDKLMILHSQQTAIYWVLLLWIFSLRRMYVG